MQFTGNNSLSLSYQTGLSFEFDLSVKDVNADYNLGFNGGYRESFVENGLILHLDASNLNSYSGDNNWNDLSTNNCDYKLVNNPTFDVDGGGSISFNGINQYGSGDAVVANKLFLFNQDYTIEILAKVSALPTQEYSGGALFGQRMGSNQLIFISGKDQNNQSALSMNYDDTRYSTAGKFTNKKISPNEWFHFTIVNRNSGNPAPDTYTLYTSYYMNGLLDFSGSAGDGNGTDDPNGEIPTYIARQGRVDAGISEMYTTGKFAVIRAYNRALNSSEIFQNYLSIKNRLYTENLNFKFASGRVFDPENRLICFYSSGENVNISGNISQNNYSYFVNDNLLCLNGKKDNFIISGFYINNPSTYPVDLNVNIQGSRPQYELFLNPVFYITGTEYLVGSINNINNLNFKIYSGSVTIPSNFTIQNISEFVYDTGYFKINTYSATQNQLEDERLYNVQLNLFTNFGTVTQNFTTTGSYSGYFNINLNLNNTTNFFTRTGIQTGLGNFQDNDYSLLYNIVSGSLRSAQVDLNKYINIKLEYYSGYTGEITGNLFATGYKNINLTGFVDGSGFVTNSSSLLMTGYHALSGINVTGLVTGFAEKFIFFTGFSNFNLNIPTTGEYLSRIITGDRNFDLSLFTSTGIIDYNNNITNVFPVKIETLPVSLPNNFGQYISANELANLVFVSDRNYINNNHSTGRVLIFTGNKINWINNKIISGTIGDREFGRTITNRKGDAFFITSLNGRRTTSLSSQTTGRFYAFSNYDQKATDVQFFERGGNFGNSLAVNSGNIVVVGANYFDLGTGAAFVYKNINRSGYFLKNDIYEINSNLLGTSISISENEKVVLAGMPYHNNLNGGVLILTGDGNFYQKNSLISGDNALFPNNIGYFGQSVSLNKSGSVGLIGSPGSNNSSGQIFILTGTGTNWATGARLTGDVGQEQFGYSVAINNYGNIGLVGAIGDNVFTGSAYFITGNETNWRKIEPKLSGESSSSNFGFSVALNASGDVAIIGAPFHTETVADNGAVYIVTGDNFNWQKSKKILGNPQDYGFGWSVDINKKGNIIAVGAPRNVFSNAGAAYIFTGSGIDWIQTDIFTGEEAGDEFGYSLSLNPSGDLIAIGAPKHSDFYGTTYIYTGTPNNFKFFEKIDNQISDSNFGSSIEVFGSGQKLIIGGPNDSTLNLEGGEIRFYEFNLSTGLAQTQKIIGNTPNSTYNFGESVSISDNGRVLLIGAANRDSTGFGYFFTGSYNDNYSLVSVVNRSSGQNLDFFGRSTSLNKQGNIAAIGAPGYGNNRGAIYIFTGNSNNEWFQNSFITGDVDAPTQFGYVLKLNDAGDLLAIASTNTNKIVFPEISGAIHLYTGSGIIKNQWIKLRTIDESTINGNSNLDLRSGLEFINNEYADLLFFTDYLSNIGNVQVVSNISQSGFIGYLTGSGIINLNENNYLLTGLITGQKYIKTFTDSFNLITGYYLNGSLTGLTDFKTNNYISGNSYINSGFIPFDLDQLYIQAKTRNYFSDDGISGLLIISGYEQIKNNSSVISTIITGIR